MKKLSSRERQTLRTATTKATAKHGLGGLEKRNSQPKPITLRRADYELKKGTN